MAKTKRISTKGEVDQRVSEIQDMILGGFTRSAILQSVSKWKLSDRQVDNYIAEATKQIKEVNAATLQDNLAIISSNLWKLYRANVTANPELARKTLMDLAKLKGLDQQVINHVIEDKRELEDLSDEELDSILLGKSVPTEKPDGPH